MPNAKCQMHWGLGYITHVSHPGQGQQRFKSQRHVDPQHSVREVPPVVRVCMCLSMYKPACRAIQIPLAGHEQTGEASSSERPGSDSGRGRGTDTTILRLAGRLNSQPVLCEPGYSDGSDG